MTRKHQAIDRYLGARVRAARIERKLSQTLLGDQLGVSFQQVQKYELGKDRISASQLLSIARTLEKDVSFFFEDILDNDNVPEDEGASVQQTTGKMRRNATAYDIKIIRMLHAIEDERIKMRLFGLMEAIVGARSAEEPTDGKPSADRWLEGQFG